MLLLRNCAACARTLDQDSKRCGNCKTPFCNAACQKAAWKRGGHRAVCGTIADGGGAGVRKLLRAGQLEMKPRAFAVWRWKASRRRQLAEDSRLLVEMMEQFEV